MSEAEMNRYRLTSMEEPGDERMPQIMQEVAEDARESIRRAALGPMGRARFLTKDKIKDDSMIGLILWAILIILIAECACPGLIWVILGSLAVYGVLYFGIMAIVDKIKNRKS